MQTSREKNNLPTALLNTEVADSSSKLMFGDSILCAQFLNDYVKGLEDIKIRPEDIEDVSERYVPLVAEERNTDTVKKINVSLLFTGWGNKA